MMDQSDYVSAIVRLAGGEIVGKTRLQKIAYLLQAKGSGFRDVEFDYHNFGPYSAELAFAAEDAESLGFLSMEERTGYHSVPYTVFRSTDCAARLDNCEEIKACKADLEVMSGYSALVLELAATAIYLKRNGYAEDFWEEVRKRKSLKATQPRVRQAKKLLKQLDL